MRVESNLMPTLIDINYVPDNNAELILRENIVKEEKVIDTENNITESFYTYDEYRIIVPNRVDLENIIKDSFDYWLKLAKNNEKEDLASSIRQTRDELLKETDKMFAADRLTIHLPTSPATSTSITSSEWLTFFNEFVKSLSNKWAIYRQQLRDIPQQPGFPYDVKWPQKPKND